MTMKILTLLAQTSIDFKAGIFHWMDLLVKIGVLVGWSAVLLVAWETWRGRMPLGRGMCILIGGIIIILLSPFVVRILLFLKGSPL